MSEGSSDGIPLVDALALDASRNTTLHPVARLKRWVLFTGGRLEVTALLLLFVFVALVALSVVRPVDMHELLNNTAAVRRLFSTLLRGAILLVSIVVSINSIVLSQEITDVEHQQERIEASVEYQRRIEALIDADVSPTRPVEFLGAILAAISRETQSLADMAAADPGAPYAADVQTFVEAVGVDIEQARETLRNRRMGTFRVLLAGLNYDYTDQLTAARRFGQKYEDVLPEEGRETAEQLVDTLEFFAVGREYFKSLYYKRELARLSSRLLYVALPVIVFTSYVILAIDPDFLPDVAVFGFSPLLLFISFAYTVALAPYLVLTAYLVRLAAITLNTLAAGPFVLDESYEAEAMRETGDDESVDLPVPRMRDDE